MVEEVGHEDTVDYKHDVVTYEHTGYVVVAVAVEFVKYARGYGIVVYINLHAESVGCHKCYFHTREKGGEDNYYDDLYDDGCHLFSVFDGVDAFG